MTAVGGKITLRCSLLLAALSAAACIREVDPCPEGTRYSKSLLGCTDGAVEGRPSESGNETGGMLDAGDNPAIDAGIVPDGSYDAGMESSSGDDAAVDSGERDAGDGGDHDDAGDAGERDAGDAETPVACSLDDEAAWREFHLSGKVVQAVGECIALYPLACAKKMCPLDDCLREKAGVTSCHECVTTEVQCLLDQCASACGANDTDDACRACACAKGCVEQFDGCAQEPLDVCSDCDGTTCANASLSPALIMVIVRPSF